MISRTNRPATVVRDPRNSETNDVIAQVSRFSPPAKLGFKSTLNFVSTELYGVAGATAHVMRVSPVGNRTQLRNFFHTPPGDTKAVAIAITAAIATMPAPTLAILPPTKLFQHGTVQEVQYGRE